MGFLFIFDLIFIFIFIFLIYCLYVCYTRINYIRKYYTQLMTKLQCYKRVTHEVTHCHDRVTHEVT
jgi:hypothetical protein